MDSAQGLREQIRVARSGGLPRYHGRYPLPGNHRIDELDLKLGRIWRREVRPRVLGVDHVVVNLDLLWQFKAAGLQDVQINGHLALVSPGDARIPPEEGVAYALARQRKALDGLIRMQEEHGSELVKKGFSQAEFDELIALKRARYEFTLVNPSHTREAMEVFAHPLLIVRGTKPLS